MVASLMVAYLLKADMYVILHYVPASKLANICNITCICFAYAALPQLTHKNALFY